MVGVQQWAEIRRLVLVEGRSRREVALRLGLARDTVAKAVRSETPPKYSRMPAGSKLDPFREWICEQLREDPMIQSQRLREMASELGYAGGKTVFDDFVREARPRLWLGGRFSGRCIGRGSLSSAICGSRASRSPLLKRLSNRDLAGFARHRLPHL